MNTRKQKINMLKQHLLLMTKGLNHLENKEVPERRSTSKSIKMNSPCYSQNRQYKSPTFWNSNPITHQNKYQILNEQRKSPIFDKNMRDSTQKSLSPKIRNITNTLDFNYYMKSTVSHYSSTINIGQQQQRRMPQKHHQKSFDIQRKSREKATKIKTYEFKKSNPILNPEKQKKTSIKIVKSIQPSPDKFLTQNPKSNTKLYCFGDKKTYLSRKGSMLQKNQSTLTLEHYPNDHSPFDRNFNSSLQKKRRSQKKHFAQYFTDILISQIQ